ncbi:MAG: class I SAM-dependent methyltransferase [Kiritimatiellae bacterium]|nr:class I SAM-dependent methyltransferase [Kiritimatiellia bacterium]
MRRLLRKAFRVADRALRPRRHGRAQAVKDPWPEGQGRREVFAHIHRINHWGDAESRSGPGSALTATRAVRAALPRLWTRLGTRVVLDAPCGDYNWFSALPRGAAPVYIGGDIVPAIVAANQTRYGDARTRFMVLDIVDDPLPQADFWLCRDCLFHLPEADVLKVLRNFAHSGIAYLCATIHPDCAANTDIAPGGFRPFNLELPPYRLGKALEYIQEDPIENHLTRQLALWDRASVARVMENAEA